MLADPAQIAGAPSSVQTRGGFPLHADAPGEAQQLREACKEFEAVLVNCMLKSMRATVPQNGLFSGGRAEEVFTGMLDEEYARLMTSSGSSGIAQALYNQLADRQ